jgi:hypothetical protein
MKNKIYSSLLVIAVALVGFFVVPVESSAAVAGWDMSFCNIEYPDGTYSTHQECDAWGGSCGDQYCCSDVY